MRARVICVGMAGLVLAIAAACSTPRSAADERHAPPQRTSASYVMTQGQTVALAPGVTLRLERINDSRCKQGAVCVWAGYISYSFVLHDQQGDTSFVLAEDMPGASKSATRHGLSFTLTGLQPAEPPAMRAPAPEYRVSLRVTISPPT